MDIKTIIICKSEKENYDKEKRGIKKNSVRLVNSLEDNILQLYISISYTDCAIGYIKIECVNSTDSFIRELTDITRFKSHKVIVYIFSWR